jgi:hypothetical protein
MMLRRCGSIVIAEDPSTFGADGLVEFDDIFSAGACSLFVGVCGGHRDEIVWTAIEDVTERSDELQRHPFRSLVDYPG